MNARETQPGRSGAAPAGTVRTTKEAMRKLVMRRPSGQFFETVVVVWLTLSAASVVLAAATWVTLSNQLNAANRAVGVRLELGSICQLLLQTQTSEADYIITGNSRYFDAFSRDAKSVAAECRHLGALAEGDSSLLGQTASFRRKAQDCLEYQEEIMRSAQANGVAAAAAKLQSGEGKRRMAAVVDDLSAMGASPSALVFAQGASARLQLTRASLTSLTAGILGIGAGLFAFWLSRMTVKHQERERELIEAKMQADRRSQEKTVFLANMSHEIRTPMNAILGFGELLENDIQEEKQRDYLQSIRRSASSLMQLINDMLDMSKIEAGVLELRMEPTDLREVLQFIKTMFCESAARKGLKLSWVIPDEVPRSLLLDRIRLRQILVNLLGNAVKFTDSGAIETRLRWQQQESGQAGSLSIEVEDTGVGIPSGRLEAIFKPFVQAGAHRDKEYQGAGLGLAIVKRLTEMMGGSVTARSEPEHGSLFQLHFPSVAISEHAPAADPVRVIRETDFNELRPTTLLAVDDNQTNCELLEAMFGNSHHRLLLAASGREGLEIARREQPDVILLDVRMPEMDGRQTLQALREIPELKTTPVIAVTASSLVEEEHEIRSQFSGYLRKPFSQHDVFQELKNFVPLLPKPAAASNEQDGEPESFICPPLPGEAIAEVERLVEVEWPPVRDSVAINQSKAFATKVDGLGQRWQCQPLIAYAKTIRRHADSYAVADLESTLLQFSHIAVELRKNART